MTDRDARMLLLDFLDAENEQVDVSASASAPEQPPVKSSQSRD